MMTPMRRQYLQIKKQYPDAIVLFRLGDFYETFDGDAEIVSRVCDIMLTSRPVGKNQRVPLAGVPYHSADAHIARLIGAGHKVAIVEQVGGGVSSHLRSEMSRGSGERTVAGTPMQGIVHREVTRVVTPGTLVEPSLLETGCNNYLAACVVESGVAGLAYADVSTGEFAATEIHSQEPLVKLGEELARLQPAELLAPNPCSEHVAQPLPPGTTVTPYDGWHFDLETAHRALADQFEVATLDGFGLGGKPQAVRAAGALIQYLIETQRGALANFTCVVSYQPDRFMVLDATTRRNLEITQTMRNGSVVGSLLGLLDTTVTPMGARQLRQWLQQPLLDVAAIRRRLDAVEQLVHDTALRTELRTELKGVADLERLTSRAVQGIIRPREMLALGRSLRAVPRLRQGISGAASRPDGKDDTGGIPLLQSFATALEPCSDIAVLIQQAIAEDAPASATTPGVIRRGFSDELDQVLYGAREAKEWIAGLEERERKRAGIKNLRVGFNRVFGYYIEVSKSHLGAVPPEYERKQTIVNGERFVTHDLKEFESRVLDAEEQQLDIEMRVYQEVCAQVAAAAPRLLATAQAMAGLDTCATLADVATHNNYVRPFLADDSRIEIIGGRHPVVELVTANDVLPQFIPNDTRMSEEEAVLVITGPNMSGKSTYLRQVALICLMAQMGSYVPAERAHIGVVDRIFTRIGAEDIIHAGQSTFMVEMVETANILHHAGSRSLLILDEVGRGTSTYDGISIAWAVVEYIHNHPNLHSRTLFATHYHELTNLASVLPRVRNYSVAVSENGGKVVFLHRIVPGGADRSYGIHVAQLAGLPRPVVNRAAEILAQMENEDTRAPAPPFGREREDDKRPTQMALFPSSPHPAIEALRGLDVNSITPLEAISKLYELQRLAREKPE
jgi:DNA mismatch repair protein MutS